MRGEVVRPEVLESRSRHQLRGGHALGHVRAPGVGDLDAPGLRRTAHPLEGRHRGGRPPVVVAQEELHVVGVGPDDGQPMDALQRQQPVLVLEEHDGLPRRLAGQCPVCGESTTEVSTWAHGTSSGGSNIPSRNRARSSRADAVSTCASVTRPRCTASGRLPVLRTAGEVRPRLEGASGRVRLVGDDVVAVEEVRERPAVGDHVSPEAPLSAEHVGEEEVAGARRVPVHAVVRAHDGVRAALGHGCLERGQVGLLEIAGGDHRVECVADRARGRSARRSAWRWPRRVGSAGSSPCIPWMNATARRPVR